MKSRNSPSHPDFNFQGFVWVGPAFYDHGCHKSMHATARGEKGATVMFNSLHLDMSMYSHGPHSYICQRLGLACFQYLTHAPLHTQFSSDPTSVVYKEALGVRDRLHETR